MANLTNADYQYIQNWVHQNRSIYKELSTWGLNKTVWRAVFQAVEDYMVNGFSATPTTSIRAAIEAVTGATTSQRAQTVMVIWAKWKVRDYTGGGG